MGDLADEAQRLLDVSGAEHKADVIAAFYLRLRTLKVPAPVCYDVTMAEFFPPQCTCVEWSDDE